MGLLKRLKPARTAKKKPTLRCRPGDPASYMCIYLASYRGFSVDIEWVKRSTLEDKMARAIISSNIEQLPYIEDKDNHFIVCGTKAVLTYLNTKGGAPSIHPRKARILAMQQYWIEMLAKFSTLVNDHSNPEHHKQSEIIINALDQALTENQYIVSEWSLADIHWLATFKSMQEQGQDSFLEKFEHIQNWLKRLQNEIPLQYQLQAQ